MNYTAIKRVNLQDLINRVNELVLEGWVPIGGVSSDGDGFVQALTQTNERSVM